MVAQYRSFPNPTLTLCYPYCTNKMGRTTAYDNFNVKIEQWEREIADVPTEGLLGIADGDDEQKNVMTMLTLLRKVTDALCVHLTKMINQHLSITFYDWYVDQSVHACRGCLDHDTVCGRGLGRCLGSILRAVLTKYDKSGLLHAAIKKKVHDLYGDAAATKE